MFNFQNPNHNGESYFIDTELSRYAEPDLDIYKIQSNKCTERLKKIGPWKNWLCTPTFFSLDNKVTV